ncbi:MAG: GNAT family N-acetyltransferase [Ideonella sp.]
MSLPDLSPDAAPVWQVRRLDELSPLELLRIMRARQQVFVVEQHCPYLDADSADEQAWHLAAWQGGLVCAYARVVDPGVNYQEASIGRVITDRSVRGRGLGRELIARAIRHASDVYPEAAIRISAQSHLQAFYAGFGFAAQGDIYLEDAIPHIEMLRSVASDGAVRSGSRTATPAV